MTKNRIFDVDLDVKSGTEKAKYGTRGMVYNTDNEKILPHPSAYYIENVPVDGLTGNAAFDYEYGDEVGYLKVDLLTNTSYDGFLTKEEVIHAMESSPDWSLLEDEEFVNSLPHLNGHFSIVSKIRPRSIQELADVLALIRPGKVHLIDQYIKNPSRTRVNLYKRASGDKVYFKRSHAISYACMIVCVMNKSKNGSVFGW